MRRLLKLVALLVAICLAGIPDFVRSQSDSIEGVKGVVTKADKRRIGEEFTFANLSSPKPFVTYPSGFGAETIKVFQDSQLIVLILVANLTGSTETYHLDRKNRRFTLVEIGAWEATATGSEFRPAVTYGRLQ